MRMGTIVFTVNGTHVVAPTKPPVPPQPAAVVNPVPMSKPPVAAVAPINRVISPPSGGGSPLSPPLLGDVPIQPSLLPAQPPLIPAQPLISATQPVIHSIQPQHPPLIPPQPVSIFFVEFYLFFRYSLQIKVGIFFTCLFRLLTLIV